jgi:hypothetical protein
MKNNKFVLISFIAIITILICVSVQNIVYNKNPNIYYANVNKPINQKIYAIELNNNNLSFKTKDDVLSYCLKTTKSSPNINSLCWQNVNNNSVKESIMTGKRYYLWIKDDSNNISDIFIIKK